MRILTITFHKAIAHSKTGKVLDEEFLRRSDAEYRRILRDFPVESQDVQLGELDEPPNEEPYEEIEVHVTKEGIHRQIPPVGQLASQRFRAISEMSDETFLAYADEVRNVVSVFSRWMRNGTIVHVIGAGRALLAASLAANRLAHGGARVYILGDKAPPPSSRFGGGVLAASASGKTPVVLEIMKTATELNANPKQSPIEVVGISDPEAPATDWCPAFRDLCTPGLFLGVKRRPDVVLRGLADLEEQAINQVLDAIVVAAGLEIGINFRLGHEDLVGGATGPWHRHLL